MDHGNKNFIKNYMIACAKLSILRIDYYKKDLLRKLMSGHLSNFQIYQLKGEMHNWLYFLSQNLKTSTLHRKNKNQLCNLQWFNQPKHWKDLNQECIFIQWIFNHLKDLIKNFCLDNIKKHQPVRKCHKIKFKNKNSVQRQELQTNR